MPEKLQKLKSFFVEKTEAQTSEAVKFGIPKLKNTNLYYWLGLIPVFIIALFIRIQNLPLLKGKYLIELDSYFFFRYAKMLFEQGSLPLVDAMRYVPVGTLTNSRGSYLFFPKTMVLFYKIIHIFFANLSQIEWHVIYPPVITIISFVFFFLLVKELLNYRIAFIATAFLAVIPAYMQRTSAGFADHEAVAMVWMFISLWLFVLAWKSDNWKKYIPFAITSGIFTSMLTATWGGYIFVVYGLAMFVFAYAFLSHKQELKYLLIFGAWVAATALFDIILTVKSRFFGTPGAIIAFVMMFMILLIILPKFIKTEKIPKPILPLIISALIALPASVLLKIDLMGLIKEVTKQNTIRLFYTVAENAQPYFTDWWSSIGWIFLLAFAGSALYFYKIFKPEEKTHLKLYLIAASAYVVFFFAFIFGRLSTSARLSAMVDFFSNTYLYWLAGFIVLLAGLYLLAFYKDKALLQHFEKKWPWLLLAIWFLITLLAARGQIRLLFATVPPIAIASAVFVSEAINWAKTLKKSLKLAALAGLILFSIFAFAIAAQQSEIQNKYSSSMTPGQWGDAMTWIRETTPANSVFAHWWDYGYMTLTLGNRSAVTDGGNEKGWNHKSGRYFLTGKDDNSTLTYLKTHNVTHILISDEEIMKYPAFSLIGSDENLDRYSSLGVFALTQQKEVRNGTLLIYQGGWRLDKDYVLGKLILSEKNAGIGGFSFVVQNNTLTEPKAYVISNGQQLEIPISCVFAQGKRMDFKATNETALNGCLMLVPYYDQNGAGNAVGGAFWMSEKVYDTNLAKLYMFNETSLYFKLAYSDDTPLGIYNGRVIGPIKIWEVNYPANITADPFYLQPDYEYG